MKHKNLMAKALYDNVPESPEELAFRKGDILTVIEQNTGGLEGWWLCSLHGRQGIAPGNRLKLLIGPMFDSPHPAFPTQGSSQGLYQIPPSQQSVYQVPPGQDIYQIPPRSVLAADAAPAKVVTPVRMGQSHVYSPGQHSNHQDLYDVPPVRQQGLGQKGNLRGQGVYDVPPPKQDVQAQGVYDIPGSSQGIYSVPPCRNNPVQEEGNYDFPQPHRPKQEGIYDVPPPSLNKAAQCSHSNYDFPSSSESVTHRGLSSNDGSSIYDVPPSQLSSGAQKDLYDVPCGMRPPPYHKVPPGGEKDRNKGIYDVPQQDVRLLGDVTDGVNRLSFSSTGSSMSTSSSSTGSPSDSRLALDLDSAMQRLCRLQQAVESSSSTLLALAASPHWRTFPFMERHANEVRIALEWVRGTLADFLVFGKGAAANATALSDNSLHNKLRRQLQRLEDSHQILGQTFQALEACGWSLNILAGTMRPQNKSDDLDRFVMVARTVPDDAKQLASTVGGNAELLFRRAPVEGSYLRSPGDNGVGIVQPITHSSTDNENYGGRTKPFPVPTGLGQDKDSMSNSEKCVKSWMEDYDYVHLQGKEEFERQQKELLDKENIIKQNKVHLEQEQLKQFKELEQEVIKPVENDITQWISHQHPSGSSSDPVGGGAHLCGRDRQLLGFYSEQCEQHFVTLLNAIDAFFGCVAAGQPPRIFVAHSKFVILSAHKLVFIGDTLSRQAGTPEVANRVMNSSNVLCDMLKTVVGATKTAALHYPNTAAVQEMVDRVAELSHQAQQFKTQLHQMASL
ncbi:enhancer of filamentation 1 [Denticeps clupeoides]|uniref:Breast cancer anti-estrogen resistance protein 1 n=1 Tax=Denticeps clupeoides TaxID=299321 RepID=A0AAY4DQM1_9TELE|nr:enhancer of filamentation 1 [Denticeps clupeoides]